MSFSGCVYKADVMYLQFETEKNSVFDIILINVVTDSMNAVINLTNIIVSVKKYCF